ncbi:MAG: protein-methionine-sulfoxide reductase catalytic subunit MsrP [Pseudomonadota bacterium]
MQTSRHPLPAIKSRPDWELPERMVTDETAAFNRRRFLKQGAASIGLLSAASALSLPAFAKDAEVVASFLPGQLNEAYKVERAVTSEENASRYNNFYEFGSHKSIWQAAQALVSDPWKVTVDGLVEEPREYDLAELARMAGFEQRIYRFRCVEAWAMVVPWDGVPLGKIIKALRPLGSARYVTFETLADSATMPGLKQFWYPWPYVEGLTIEEAMNEVAFLAFGMYGKLLPKQNGAPVRLVVPWKYGFKNIKSIVRITFSDTQPETFWEAVQKREYGFWANVNPEVDHPRWSQAQERMLGSGERVPTLPWNGYGDQVAHLYAGMEETLGDRLFR